MHYFALALRSSVRLAVLDMSTAHDAATDAAEAAPVRLNLILRGPTARMLRDLHGAQIGDDPETTITATARNALRRGLAELTATPKRKGAP